MVEEFECEECGREFDSKRGLSIHQTQKHEEEDQNKEVDNSSAPEGFFIGVRTALIVVFILGIIVGFSAGFVTSSVTGISPNSDNTVEIQGDSNNQEEEQQQGSSKIDISKIDSSNDPVLGEKNAEVTMVVYEDFECPFCSKFEENAVKQIKENYIDSGQVKMVWKDFPLERIHPWARPSAETMECVYRQDEEAFWNVKDRIFDNQDSLDASNAEDRIIGWATEEGVSEDNIRSCMENGSPGDAVTEDLQEGQSFEAEVGGSPFVSGTPATVIYSEGDKEGEPLVGAQPYTRFKTIIDSKLE